MRTILIISAGIEAVSAIKLAKSMGLYVIVSDGSKSAPGLLIADDYFISSTYDIKQTVFLAKKYHENIRPIDGVICVASDVPLTVASVALELGIPGIPISAAKLAMDKLEMKKWFYKDGLPVPWFSPVESVNELRNFVYQTPYQIVIKPVDSRGSRGVLLLNKDLDLSEAYQKSHGYSPTGRVMVERFLSGPQVSTESLVINGEVYTPGFADRNYDMMEKFSPIIIENGGNLPSLLDINIKQATYALLDKAASSMGIYNGVIKGDIVIHNGKPYLIEIAARLSGGYFCTHKIPMNTGVDLVGAAIRQCLGEKINPNSLKPIFDQPIAERYWFPEPGVVISIDGKEKYINHPDVIFLDIRVQPGDRINSIDSHLSRAGLVITKGESVELAIQLAEEVIKGITIKTNPC